MDWNLLHIRMALDWALRTSFHALDKAALDTKAQDWATLASLAADFPMALCIQDMLQTVPLVQLACHVQPSGHCSWGNLGKA